LNIYSNKLEKRNFNYFLTKFDYFAQEFFCIYLIELSNSYKKEAIIPKIVNTLKVHLFSSNLFIFLINSSAILFWVRASAISSLFIMDDKLI